jgi:hypothetical protein
MQPVITAVSNNIYIYIYIERERERERSRVSSGSIVSDYGLDNRAIGVLGPTQPPVQWVPGILSPGVKRGRVVVMLTPHPHLVLRS